MMNKIFKGGYCTVLIASLIMTGCATTGKQAVKQVPVKAVVKNVIIDNGLEFRDLNDNGSLDVYEDWRESIDNRVTDLISKMTLEEKAGLMTQINTNGQFAPSYPVTEKDIEINRKLIVNLSVNHILDNNNGTPDYLAKFHNTMQEIAESTRLGIPITFTCDRGYNAWGGMYDMPHAAFGSSRDEELTKALFQAFAKEMKAVGYHVALQPMGVELFRTAWGDDHERVSMLTEDFVVAYENNGVQTTLKHFLANGYSGARSEADLLKNYTKSWQAGIDAGASWAMICAGRGIGDSTTDAHYSKETMNYLRKDLGYDGVVVTDWFAIGYGRRPATGVTTDGINIEDLSLAERYALMINLGIDQFGGENAIAEVLDDTSGIMTPTNFPNAIVEAVNTGLVDIEKIDTACTRILLSKFKLGIFDNPYVDLQTAADLAGSDIYARNPGNVIGTPGLLIARNPEMVALDQELQTSSAVLLKNSGILPFSKDINISITGGTEAVSVRESEAIDKYANISTSIADADVAVIRMSYNNNPYSPLPTGWEEAGINAINEASQAGVPVVLILDLQTRALLADFVENDDIKAVLLLNYSSGSDHGVGMGNNANDPLNQKAVFLGKTLPDVLASMLFGDKEPTGKLAYDFARSARQSVKSWGDVPFDFGATDEERWIIVDAIRNGKEIPTNLGDPLFMYNYGMEYGKTAEVSYSDLVVPSEAKSGKTFTISFTVINSGDDGYTVAEILDNGSSIDSTFVALNGDDMSRVVDVQVKLSGKGSHQIAIGDLAAEVTIK